MAPDLTTTNRLLGIMAMVNILEGVLIVAVLAAMFALVRGVLKTVRRLEAQQVTPALVRVNGILDDVKDVTATVRQQADRAERVTEWMAKRIARPRHQTETGA